MPSSYQEGTLSPLSISSGWNLELMVNSQHPGRPSSQSRENKNQETSKVQPETEDRFVLGSKQMRSVRPTSPKRGKLRQVSRTGPSRFSGCCGHRIQPPHNSENPLPSCLLWIPWSPLLSLEKRKQQNALANRRRNQSLHCCSPSILIKLVVRCKLLPKLHVHLLPTALNDYNWHIKKARQPTCIHYCISPQSASVRSWVKPKGPSQEARGRGGGTHQGTHKP